MKPRILSDGYIHVQALAPSLRVLDEIQKDTSITRLLFCGVGCAVQAFRAVQSQLGLDEVYVIGTNCADNSPTPKAAQNFLVDGVGIDPKILDTIQGYEFMQDFQVHVKSTTNANSRKYCYNIRNEETLFYVTRNDCGTIDSKVVPEMF